MPANGDTIKAKYAPRLTFGRAELLTDVDEITADNIVSVLSGVWATQQVNQMDIGYLFDRLAGKHPVMYKEKRVRPEINNIVIENRDQEIVAFEAGYLLGEPIQYVNISESDTSGKNIEQLNRWFESENKSSVDAQLAEDRTVCGTSYRITLPDEQKDADEAPFETYRMNPATTFVIYGNSYTKKPMLGVSYTRNTKTQEIIYDCYTDKNYYRVIGAVAGKVDKNKSDSHPLGMIPIIENKHNNLRLGTTEMVASILDAINMLDSNRLDAVAQHVQSFMKFINIDITEDDYEKFLERGVIKVKSVNGALQGDVDMVSVELSQQQTQVLKDDLVETYMRICGIPRTGNSTSDARMGASLVGNGWTMAETRAKISELMFREADRESLKLTLRICREKIPEFDMNLSDIQIKFTRRNFENLQSKSQSLQTLLNCGMTETDALKTTDIVPDPEQVARGMRERKEENVNDLIPNEVIEVEKAGDGTGEKPEPTVNQSVKAE
jgi:SPP1 family phage portal protein